MSALPLVVDMDGTLLLTDSLLETACAGLARRPLGTLARTSALLRGRAALKAALCADMRLKVDHLPLREDFLAYLREQWSQGRPLFLVSAADQSLVQRVAERCGIFAGAFGSDGVSNLKGRRKLEFLQKMFPDGFAYAGDARADLKVWTGAEAVVLAGASPGVAAEARRLGKPVEIEFANGRAGVAGWLKLLRWHQWTKNLLVFVPLLLGVNAASPPHILACLGAFALLSVAASATYIINDLLDLESDRAHRSKRFRPLASGAVPIREALLAGPIMLAVAIGGAFALAPQIAAALVAYVALTLTYSIRVKRVPMLDVVALGALYTLRIVIGTLAAGTFFSAWLLTFSAFFFFSLSLAKRHVEVTSAAHLPPDTTLPGRGYKPSDAPLTLALGVASSVAAVLVNVQYMMADAFPSNVYSRPVFLWAAPLMVGLWACRIWLLAHRGELHDDPVAFAIQDRVSLALGGLMGVAFLLARI